MDTLGSADCVLGCPVGSFLKSQQSQQQLHDCKTMTVFAQLHYLKNSVNWLLNSFANRMETLRHTELIFIKLLGESVNKETYSKFLCNKVP